MAKGKKTGGRKAGTPNKLTASAREAFQEAFEGLGGIHSLTHWAMKNPDDFYKLYARLIPIEVENKGEQKHEITIRREIVTRKT
ncbi:MAG TPA: hypothetical protein PKN30_08775 [Flavobacteriales bacterium]|nr:hypothetical protein [Flavobacteriales bacterium]